MLDALTVQCPYCGERFEALVDASAGDAAYIEDCPVCCRPIALHLRLDEEGQPAALEASRDD
ncbi:CPXCG motif-containing cysteine-rich protein [Luteimonas sp. SX5]|uniref:CPXCG motif-containing cysteine-rich protein n=1 Tax=Luteimonas galliterrae TaxID=2940486 RepID=A0ABT0MKN6_9GAMM|nr:CPXCG motif-containing cysteine-rich protein [Luteimonas galliterrae]MCL1635444.1 CPXCG motif-containing cysteine-rich protein [Luteimonas galliterrae]